MEQAQVQEWLAAHLSAEAAVLVGVTVFVVIEVAKAARGAALKVAPPGSRLGRALAAFDDWWAVSVLLGAALGAWQVEPSLAGAVTGVLVACLTSGGYTWLRGLGRRLDRPSRPEAGPPGWTGEE